MKRLMEKSAITAYGTAETEREGSVFTAEESWLMIWNASMSDVNTANMTANKRILITFGRGLMNSFELSNFFSQS
jgi:hypothetical protein